MRSKDYISPTAMVLEMIPGSAVLQASASPENYNVTTFDWSEEGYLD